MAKRGVSLVVLIISATFFVSSLVVMVGSWFANQPITENLLASLEQVDSDLAAVEADLQSAQASLTSLQEQIDLLQSLATAIGVDSEENTRILSEVVQSIDESLSPIIDRISGGVGTLSEAFLALKDIVERLNALPLVSIEIPGADKLEELSNSVLEQQNQITQLRERVQKFSQVTQDTLATLSSGFTNFEAAIDEIQVQIREDEQKVAAYRTTIAELETDIPSWIDRAMWGLTAFLIWFAFSQAALFVLAWSFYSEKDLLARWRSAPTQ